MPGQPAQQLERIKHDAAPHRLGGAADVRQSEIIQSMEGHIIAKGDLVGTYQIK